MKEEGLKKASYTAPKMEVVSFRTERGYAESPGPGPVQDSQFIINVVPGGL